MHIGMLAETVLEPLALCLLFLPVWEAGMCACTRGHTHTHTYTPWTKSTCVFSYRRQCDYATFLQHFSMTLMESE